MTSNTAKSLQSQPIGNLGSNKGRTMKILGDGYWLKRTRHVLKDFFTPFNIKLAELLDDPWFLSWNKT